MHDREIPPRAELCGVVRCIWELRELAGEAGAPERVVPDGCPDILSRADRFRRGNDGDDPHTQARSFWSVQSVTEDRA